MAAYIIEFAFNVFVFFCFFCLCSDRADYENFIIARRVRLWDTTTGWETSSKANQCVTPPWRTNKTAISAEEQRLTHYEGGWESVLVDFFNFTGLCKTVCLRVFVGRTGKNEVEMSTDVQHLIWIFFLFRVLVVLNASLPTQTLINLHQDQSFAV